VREEGGGVPRAVAVLHGFVRRYALAALAAGVALLVILLALDVGRGKKEPGTVTGTGTGEEPEKTETTRAPRKPPPARPVTVRAPDGGFGVQEPGKPFYPPDSARPR
jgi:hypothetical protein